MANHLPTAAVPSARARSYLLGLVPLSGTIWVAAGTALLGASGYAFLTITARFVPAALGSLDLLVAQVGPGLFLAVKQETTRLLSRWQALRMGTRDSIGNILAMVVQVLQPSLVALAKQPVIAAAWLAGTVCFALAFALTVDPVAAAATAAQLVTGLATTVVLSVALHAQLTGSPQQSATEALI